MQEHDFQLSLSQLNIQNFATFKDQSINFNDQFNAIIGETGSGKSLILDAIQLILGHRATKKLIRKGFEFAIVEAVFSCNKTNLKPYFNDIGFPFEDEIVIKRVLYKNGKTKSFLNMQSCSLGTLIDFSRKFIDLVGQFENQKLLSDDYQRQLLDNFSQAKPLLTKYQSSYIKLNATQKELADLKQIEADHSQKMDYLSFQINEIETLSPSVDHELELLEKKKAFQSKEENKKTIAKINSYFEGSSTTRGLNEQLGAVANLISSPLVTSDDISSFLNAKEIINDLSYKINSSFNDDLDEQELDTVLDELDEYQKLKRKFNVSTTELVAKYHAFLVERDQISNVSESIELLKTKEAMLREDAFQIAQKLHELRVKQSIKLSTKLTAEIQKLKMNRAKVVIEVSKQDFLTINGFSSIAFTVQTNPGENFYKIKDIASGGELSRILLAIRTILSVKDSISIFLFDEIDSGIGGETALTVGQALANVAASSQVIAITHLPQIANFANKLVLVSKEFDKERTFSHVKEVVGKNLKEEVTQMTRLI